MSWRTLTIGDLVDDGGAEIQTGPFGTQLKASDYVGDGTPVINVRNIGYGGLKPEKIEFVSDETAERLSSHLLEPHDFRLLQDDFGFERGETPLGIDKAVLDRAPDARLERFLAFLEINVIGVRFAEAAAHHLQRGRHLSELRLGGAAGVEIVAEGEGSQSLRRRSLDQGLQRLHAREIGSGIGEMGG